MHAHGRTTASSLFRLFGLPGALPAVLGALVATLLLSSPVEAGPHRARLARDLADRIAAASNESGAVILEGDRAKVERLAVRYGLRIRRHLAHGAVVELNGGQLDALSQDPEVDHLSSDLPVHGAMAVTTAATGADLVWRGLEGLRGYTGRGIGVAVIDSGIANHPALRDRVVASVDFTGANTPGVDDYGHGTHVAGIIAGYEPNDGFVGMAPGAHLIDLRVLGPDGSGWTSNIITAIDWATEHRSQFAIRVINLSLGHPVVESYREDPLCQAVERAVRAGIVVVASAGNNGQDKDGQRVFAGIESPGNSPWTLTVGATDSLGTPDSSDDVRAPWSSSGPTPIDRILKPNLAAPGRQIVSTGVQTSALWTDFPERQVFIGPGLGVYQRLSGTSMAAGVVSGAVALLLEADSQLSPLQVRVLLTRSATFIPEAGLIGVGAGSISVESAVELLQGLTSDRRGNSNNSASKLRHGRAGVRPPIKLRPTSPGTSSIGWGPPSLPDIIGWGALSRGKIIGWGALSKGNIIGWGALSIADIIGWGALSGADIIGWGAITSSGSIIGWGAITSSGSIIGWGALTHSDIIGWGASVDGDIIGWGATADSDIIGWGAAADSDIIGWGATADGDIIGWGATATDGVLGSGS